MERKWTFWAVFGVLTACCVGWIAVLVIDAVSEQSIRRGAAAARAKKAAAARGEIVIGAAGHWEMDTDRAMLRGIEMAAAEINAAGGVMGRPVKIVPVNDEWSLEKGRRVAEQLADRADVVAVIGHTTSAISIPTSVIYQYAGVLMLSPEATSPKLTSQGYRLVFRTIPSDTSIGAEMARYAHQRGYRNVGIYYLQDEYGRGIANAFEHQAAELGIHIFDRHSYENTAGEGTFAEHFDMWVRNFSFDAVFVAGLHPQASLVIKQARKSGIRVPILCGESMDTDDVLSVAGKAAEGTVIAATFNDRNPVPEVQRFREDYLRRYGTGYIDSAAANGYDAVKVLTHAMTLARSTVPDRVADALRSVRGWQGVTGSHTFDDNGDVIDKTIWKKTIRDGRFIYLNDPPEQQR